MIPARQALERLKDGNRRFVTGRLDLGAAADEARRSELVEGQEPFAVILGCSDSRVPAEIVFDQGLGDLFVIRVAGNIVAPSLVGSVEFAADKLGTRLVVVMGHSGCGAVQATLDELERPSASRSPNLHSIVERIRPSVEPLLETELKTDRHGPRPPRRPRQRPRLRQPPAPRLRGPGAADRHRRPPRRRRRVLPRNRRGRLLRRGGRRSLSRAHRVGAPRGPELLGSGWLLAAQGTAGWNPWRSNSPGSSSTPGRAPGRR